MIADIWTVAWREWKHITSQSRDWKRMITGAAGILILLIVLEQVISLRAILEAAPDLSVFWILIWVPLGNALTQAIDAFAGERERHTLETLLASRLPEFAMLAGKAAAVVAYAWLTVMGIALGALVAINIASFSQEGLFLYSTTTLLIAPPASLLTACMGAAVGILVSLRAPTIRHANTRLFMAVTLVPVLALGVIIPAAIAVTILVSLLLQAADGPPFTAPDVNATLLITAGAITGTGFIILLIVLLLVIARIRFQRHRMIVTEDQRSLRERLFGKRAPTAGDEQPEPSTRLETLPVPQPSERGMADPIPYEAAGANGTGAGASGIRNLVRDMLAVAWKEWQELRMLYREWRGGFWFTLLFLGFMTFQMSWALSSLWIESPSISIIWWLAAAAVLPLVITPRIAESIAGERERHTGEILFASRLNGLAILIGKVIIAALPAWLLVLGIPAIGLVTVNLVGDQEGLMLYPTGVFFAGLTVTLLLALLIASLGLVISMQAETTQQAAKRLAWFIVPYLLVPGLGLREIFQGNADGFADNPAATSQVPAVIENGDLLRTTLLALPLLLVVAVGLLTYAAQRFRRGRMVFD